MNCRVAVAVSAYKSDAAVISLLDRIFAYPHPDVITVIVVDSLGSGQIGETAKIRNWQVLYENANTNLGSAGNLARRLELAAKSGAEWCLCLNHDANWSTDRLSAMLLAAISRPRVGAVYPILDHSPRQPRWEDGRRHFKPSASSRLSEVPKGEPVSEVSWSSSNSALYCLVPLAENVAVMSELWMGYEDLAYGIALNRAGWQQLSCRAARLNKVFDYTPRNLFGRTFYIPDKPEWYMYYNIRNLIIIRNRYGNPGVSSLNIIAKLVQSTVRILLFERAKILRLKLLYWGVVSGIKGESGKGPFP